MSQSVANHVVVKQVTKISPMLPIAVLLVASAQAYRILHKYCLSDKHGLAALEATCQAMHGRYFSQSSHLDKITCLLVETWKPAVWDPATRVLLLEFSGLVAAITLIGLISSNRSSAGTVVKWGTTTFLLLMQVIGGAVVLPVYYALIVGRSSSAARASFVPSGTARAMLPALVVGYVLPTLVLLAPELLERESVLEWAIAFWQIFPVIVSAVAILLTLCLSGVNGSKTTSDAMISTTFVISSMDFVILLSFLSHLYAMYSVWAQGLGLTALLPAVELQSTRDVINAFLTFDFLGFIVSTWTLIFYDTSRFAGVGRTSLTSAALIAVFGTLALGPGGAVAWAWSNIEKARLGAIVADRPIKEAKQVTPQDTK